MAETDVIVYDIETKESFAEIGVRDPRRLHISVIGAYSYAERRLAVYREDELPLFWRRLETCSLLVGFNNKGFDDIVVSTYFPEISKVPSFDMLEEVHRAIGFRVKLENLAQATLGEGKSGHGLQAIELYRQGKIDELCAYCQDDVRITKDLYDYGKQNGLVYYSDLQGKKEAPVNFRREVAPEVEGPINLSLF